LGEKDNDRLARATSIQSSGPASSLHEARLTIVHLPVLQA
jgi:hypothetical protein